MRSNKPLVTFSTVILILGILLTYSLIIKGFEIQYRESKQRAVTNNFIGNLDSSYLASPAYLNNKDGPYIIKDKVVKDKFFEDEYYFILNDDVSNLFTHEVSFFEFSNNLVDEKFIIYRSEKLEEKVISKYNKDDDFFCRTKTINGILEYRVTSEDYDLINIGDQFYPFETALQFVQTVGTIY